MQERLARLRRTVTELFPERHLYLRSGGPTPQLAAAVEKRHAALAMLLTQMKGAPGEAQALGPVVGHATLTSGTPTARIQTVELGQDQLLDAAETYAKSRADRLRLAFR